MCTLIPRQIPNLHAPAIITADNLPLIRVDDDVVDSGLMGVVALDSGGTVPSAERSEGGRVGTSA